ncbi:MAG: hypothetical protein AAGU11_05195 [Syntrophobacteraceae bacterium]
MRCRIRVEVFVLALAFLLVGTLSAHALTYSRTDNYQVGTTRTDQHPFSNGFDIKSIEFAADSDAGTLEVTFTFPCEAGNANASPNTECQALNKTGAFASASGAASCLDSDPNLNCDKNSPNGRRDAPDDANDETESYVFSIYQPADPTKSSNLKIKAVVYPAKSSNNVTVTGGSAGITPSNIPFNTSSGNSVTFKITSMNGTVDLSQDWAYVAQAYAQYDGPGEDSVNNVIKIDRPGFRCVYKTFYGSQTAYIPVGSQFPIEIPVQVQVENEGNVDLDITIKDELDPKLEYVIGSTKCNAGSSSPGFPCSILPQPTMNGDQLIWHLTAKMPQKSILVFDFKLTLSSLKSGEWVRNYVSVTSPGLPDDGGPQCTATLYHSPATPNLTRSGFIAALLALSLAGIYLARRRKN